MTKVFQYIIQYIRCKEVKFGFVECFFLKEISNRYGKYGIMSKIFSSEEFYVDTHNKILYSHCMSSCCHPSLIIQGDSYSVLHFIGQDRKYITCIFKDLKFGALLSFLHYSC